MSTSSITRLPPVVTELRAIFDAIPDGNLLRMLRGPRRRGRPGYNVTILWRCYVAYYVLGLPSVSDLIRALHNNPYIAKACGIGSPNAIPSQPTFSRFGARLARKGIRTAVRDVQRELTRIMYRQFPDFGKSVAIDSTDIKAWANGAKRLRPTDSDAGWIVKKNTQGKKKYVWGYKVHILCDTEYEMPIAIATTRGNFGDVKMASPLLRQARFTHSAFRPSYVLADAGYSSDALRRLIKRQYRAEPVIDPNPIHKRAVARTIKTPEWRAIYNKRSSVERLNGRLKMHRKLDHVRVRGRFKVQIHALLSIIVTQARALAYPPDQIRHCVRAA